MIPLTAAQQALSEARDLAVVNFVELTTYTNRDAETVDTVYRFSDRYSIFLTEQWHPLLVNVETQVDDMPHLPPVQGGLAGAVNRTLELTLKQGDIDGTALYDDLRGGVLEFAQVAWYQLLIEPSDDVLAIRAEIAAAVIGDRVVRFRGDFEDWRVRNDSIRIEARSRRAEIPWIIATDATKVDPRDIGRRLPYPYGEMPKVRGVAWDVGFVTTLAEFVPQAATTIRLSDASGLASTGTTDLEIGSDTITWTGKTGNQLTGVSGVLSAHALGEIALEVTAGGTWIFSGQEVSAIGDVWAINPVTGDAFRLDETALTFTKTPNDTTTISGETVASVSFTKAQLRDLVADMFQAASVTQQPIVNHTVSGTELSEESPTSGESACRDNNTSTGFTISTDFSEVALVDMTFPSHAGIASRVVRVHVDTLTNTGSQDHQYEVRGSGAIGEIESGVSGWFEFNTSTQLSSTVRVQVDATGPLGTGEGWGEVNEVRQIPTVDAAQPTLSTDAAIRAAEIGFGLVLFADISGPEASAGDYIAANGVVLEKMPDILRHVLATLAGETMAAISSDWDDAAAAGNLDDNEHALVLNVLGSELAEIVARAAFDSRANIVVTHGSAATPLRTWEMFVAENDYTWDPPGGGAVTRTLERFENVTERQRPSSEIFTRFRGLYGWDATLGMGPEAFKAVVRIDDDQNDVHGSTGGPSDTEIGDAEDDYGRRELEALVFPTIQDELTAEEVLGYYAKERIRSAVREFDVEGLVWAEGYDLAQGDVVNLVVPWITSDPKVRVLRVLKDTARDTVNLACVEVA